MPAIFDAHLHIIDPRFPLVSSDGFVPQSFTTDDYLARTKPLDVVGGTVVSGSFQAFDQTYLIAALKTLGPAYVGVTQLPASISDEEILKLDRIGVRAVRFNVVRGGSEDVAKLDGMARRIYDLARWHVELYIESRALAGLLPVLKRLPAMSIDHLGLTRDSFDDLLALVEHGAHVKASGFGRIQLDVPKALRMICDTNPGALMFGSDLPSTRAARAFREEDIYLIRKTLDEAQAQRVLHDNAVAFYRPGENLASR
jgi:predicted TIM-barrel fold metal-dependent hydrolase